VAKRKGSKKKAFNSLALLGDVLSANKEKPFVQRILDPGGENPALRNALGGLETHRMAAEIDADGKTWVFPTIVMTPEGGLHSFDSPHEAMEYNKAMGNAIEFPDIQSAAEWTQNYKPANFLNYYRNQYGQ